MSRTFFVKFLSCCKLVIYDSLGYAEAIGFKDGEVVGIRNLHHHDDHKTVDVEFLDGWAYAVDRDLFTFDI